jgi:hypothetical protein
MSAREAGLGDFIVITELAEGAEFADPLFRRKYGAPAPRHGRHLLAWYRTPGPGWIPVAYLNYLPFKEAMLIGGACTDGERVRAMTEAQRARIAAGGGLMLQLVRYGEARFAAESVGTFGHCGDERSWSVLAQCGYVRMDDPHLIVRWNREPDRATQERWIADLRAIGPF